MRCYSVTSSMIVVNTGTIFLPLGKPVMHCCSIDIIYWHDISHFRKASDALLLSWHHQWLWSVLTLYFSLQQNQWCVVRHVTSPVTGQYWQYIFRFSKTSDALFACDIISNCGQFWHYISHFSKTSDTLVHGAHVTLFMTVWPVLTQYFSRQCFISHVTSSVTDVSTDIIFSHLDEASDAWMLMWHRQ